MKKQIGILFGVVAVTMLIATGCSSSSNNGGKDDGTNDVDTTTLAPRVEAIASALVPTVKASGISGSIALARAITYGTRAVWSTYLTSSNSYVLTDVFGDPDETPQVVTKIRVLLRQFKGTLENIVSQDPAFTCQGNQALTAGDTITVAFYGEIANGTADNRLYRCVSTSTEKTLLYGRDNSGVIRVISQSDVTSANAEEVASRGSQKRIMVVISSTYAEATEDSSTVGYVDLQFSHGSSYMGPDETFSTADDVIFKSRSRITGRAVLDSSGTPVGGSGDFAVTKYDASNNVEGSSFTTITKILGRGNFASSEYSLLKIASTLTALASIPGTFCIQTPTSGGSIPSYADDPTNCASFETAFPWTGHTFLFTPLPVIDESFESKSFFEGNDTDMIANSGSNFVIPTY